MLAALRKSSKSWVIRILFVFLIISFAAWGVGDMIQGRSRNAPAISVGDIKVTGIEFAQRYESEKRDLRRARATPLSDEELRKMGFPQYIAQKIMSEALIAQTAKDLNMTVTDDTLRAMIARQPAFRDRQGNFDSALYAQVLRNMGLSEAAFLAEQRREIMTQQIRNAVIGGLAAPQAIVEPLFSYTMEKRSAEQIDVPLSAIPVPGTPSDEEIKAFHEKNKDLFMAPEYRALTALLIKTSDFLPHVQIDEKAIADAYTQRQDEFHTEERRHLKEIVFANEADARAALENGKDATSLDALVGKLTTKKEIADLGWSTRPEILYPALANAVFTMQTGQISQPLQTPRGWLLVEVAEVEEGRPQTLAELRDTLLKDLTSTQARVMMFDELNKIRDQIGGGATLEEIAEGRKLTLLRIPATDMQGLDPKGEAVADLQLLGSPAAFLQTSFQLESGMDSDLSELNEDVYFDVRVDSITPPAVRPLETVRDQVIVDWKAEKRQEEALTLANSLVEKIKGGESMEAAAATIGQTVIITPPVTRMGADSQEVADKLTLPLSGINELFKLKAGEVGAVATDNGAVIVRLKEIVPTDPTASPALLDQMRISLLQDMRSDIFSQFLQTQAVRYDARVNEGIINRQIGGE